MKLRKQKTGRGGYSATAGLHFDDEEFESRLVWIWSAPRSGSTWLLHMLSHPLKSWTEGTGNIQGFVTPPEWQGPVEAIPVATTYVANHLLPSAGRANYSDDLVPLTFASALGMSNRANYFFSAKYEDAWRPELRRMLLVRFHRWAERAAERHDVASPLVLLKEAGGGHAAPLVMSMFPRSKLVFLVRDGRDVVDSQAAANQPGGWLPMGGWTTPAERLEFVRERARTWAGDMAAIGRAFDAHQAGLRQMVRYEDLLADPASSLERLTDWLGLRRTEESLAEAVEANAFKSIESDQKGSSMFFRSATPGSWRENMTSEETAVLESVMGAKLRQLGYPVAASESIAGKSPGVDL
jgi:sulfotransferase family protein